MQVVPFTCAFHHGALQLQEDHSCTFGKGRDRTTIIALFRVDMYLKSPFSIQGFCRYRSLQNPAENTDRNSSVSCLSLASAVIFGWDKTHRIQCDFGLGNC